MTETIVITCRNGGRFAEHSAGQGGVVAGGKHAVAKATSTIGFASVPKASRHTAVGRNL